MLVCFVTFNIQNGCGVTFAGAIGDAAWQALHDAVARTGCTMHAACLMPDHVHLLLSPSGQGESVSDIIARTKSWMCHVLKRDCNAVLRWQTSFYDHCLRDSERTEDAFQTIVYYIRQNPQSAGLPDDYPYTL
jgi:REP element-mobilizing transposase RayT